MKNNKERIIMKRFADFLEAQNSDSPCWKGYQAIGMKNKNGKKVPNCVPVKEENDSE